MEIVYDLFYTIVKYLDLNNILNMLSTNKRINRIINSNWKYIIKDHFNMINEIGSTKEDYINILLERIDMNNNSVYKIVNIFHNIKKTSILNLIKIKQTLNYWTNLIINLTLANVNRRKNYIIEKVNICNSLYVLNIRDIRIDVTLYDFSFEIKTLLWNKDHCIDDEALNFFNLFLSGKIIN